MQFQNKISGNALKSLKTQVQQFNSQLGKTNPAKNQALDKDAFLKLLTVQLSKQDPLSPMDNMQFVSQMAQFTSLEQMKNMNQEVAAMRKDFSKQNLFPLIGKQISFFNPTTETSEKGKVEKVFLGSKTQPPTIFVNGKKIPYNYINSVGIDTEK